MSYASYSSQGYSAPPAMDPTMTLPPSFNPMFMPHNFLLPAFASSPPPKSQTTTVFVGNIHEKCSNEFLERILRECGTVVSWKRIQGAQGKPQAFGFCEFVQPDGTLRALRLVGKLRLFDKDLIVKAEDKVRDELRTWFADKRKEQGKPPLEIKDDEIPADDDDRKGDKEVLGRILAWAKDEYPNVTISASAKADTSSSSVAVADEKKRDDKDRRSDRDRGRDHKRKRRSSKSPSHDRSRSHHRRRRSRSSSANTYSSGDSDEEDKKEEKRELKKKLREKEKLYNARLSKWEEREDKMKRYYRKYEQRKKDDFDSRKREGERLRYFLEHYIDEKEDRKWYSGSELRRRRKQFSRQNEEDAEDREAELREIEELKVLEAKTREETAAAAAAAAEAAAKMDTSEAKDTPPAEMTTEVKAETNKWTMSGLFNGSPEASTSAASAPVAQVQPAVVASPRVAIAGTSSTPSTSSAAPAVAKESSLSSRLQHVFGVDDEEEVDHMKTRKQLKPFEIDAKERLHMTEQERRILTREIVSKIPTKRDEVFSYNLDWSKLDDNMMNSKIIPWVSKKLATFIGEEDTALSDFVCQKVAQHKTPGDILLDIKIILDDDAELFVMKLWRLLIFEIEAKKIGLPTDR